MVGKEKRESPQKNVTKMNRSKVIERQSDLVILVQISGL